MFSQVTVGPTLMPQPLIVHRHSNVVRVAEVERPRSIVLHRDLLL